VLVATDAIGVPAALLSSRLVASMLFGLRATDRRTVCVPPFAVMLAIAALADTAGAQGLAVDPWSPALRVIALPSGQPPGR